MLLVKDDKSKLGKLKLAEFLFMAVSTRTSLVFFGGALTYCVDFNVERRQQVHII